MKKIIFNIFLLLISAPLFSQNKIFTHQDSLRGSITKERIWWDLKHYDLNIKVVPETTSILGKNSISYEVLKTYQIMQIDLQEPMKITKIIQNDSELNFTKDGYSYFIKLKDKQLKGDTNELTVFF